MSIDENKLAFELGKWTNKLDSMYSQLQCVLQNVEENPVLSEHSINILKLLSSDLFDLTTCFYVDDLFPEIYESE